jgi:hypothetical protein
MTLRLCGLLALVLLTACSNARDQAVVSTVLDDFTSRSDVSLPSAGITLIAAETEPWSAEKYRYFNFDPRRDTCGVSSQVVEQHFARNVGSESAGWLVQSRDRWRLATLAELDSLDDGVPTLLPYREEVRTSASISWPTYSADGSSALVLVHFRWSIHDAVAHYVVEGSGLHWKVRCSQFRFYV